MPHQIQALLLPIVGFISLVLFFLAFKSNKTEKEVETRLLSMTATAPTNRNYLDREQALSSTSFSERVLFPFAQKVFDKTQSLIPLSSKSWVKIKLIQGGMTNPKYPKIFLGIQLLLSATLFGSMFFMAILLGRVPGLLGWILCIGAGVVGYGFPLLWLIQQAQKRQDGIQKSLPDFLDLMVICMEAGLGLDTAIQKICTMKSVRTSAFLRQELQRYGKDINIGKSRREALLDLGARTGLEDFNTVVNALVQAYEMGTSVAHTLRVQSDTMRVKRLQKAEEKANKIPVKMVLPIYIFLFPTIFLAIFGPIGMLMVKTVMKIFGQLSHLKGN